MRVVAIANGHFDHYREIGDVFEVPDGSTATWFKPANKSTLAEAEDLKENPTRTADSPIALSQIKNQSLV